ncbi:MAG: hypothetical protein CSA38_05405 [Flavobacteriales bacterium]|nr:MAG: hypothetical protein CSA38_05405 [Flavobacteriales bacterium]
MKKLYSLAMVAMATITMNAQSDLAFAGGDFEDFAAFTGGLNSYGLQSFATQGVGEGVNGSNSLSIDGTQSGNKYVFTAKAPAGLSADVSAITFMVKGTSPSKSISLNVYKAGTEYYRYNVGDLMSEDVTIEATGSNQYSGAIDTAGNWVKVTLNMAEITDYNTDTSKDFFAFKIGKNSEYAIDVDDFKLVTSMGTVDLELIKPTDFIKNTIVKDEIHFATKSEVKVFDMNGKLIKTALVSKDKSLDMSDLPKGNYIVAGTVKGQKVSEKVMKK